VPSVVETYHGREGWPPRADPGSFAPDRLLSRFVTRVIAVSEAARDFLVRVKGYPADKVVVVSNGRNLSASCLVGPESRARIWVSIPTRRSSRRRQARDQKGHRFSSTPGPP